MRSKKDNINASVCLPRDWHRQLKEIAEREQCSISDLLRQLVKNFLSGNIQTWIYGNENKQLSDKNEHGGSTDA